MKTVIKPGSPGRPRGSAKGSWQALNKIAAAMSASALGKIGARKSA
jgi:hypothetical protein